MHDKFKNRIKGLRTAKGLTQKDVADAAGISLRAYVSYENDKKPKTRETYQKLAKALGCDVNYLLGDDPKDADDSILATLLSVGMFAATIMSPVPVASALNLALTRNARHSVSDNSLNNSASETEGQQSPEFKMVLEMDKKLRKFRLMAQSIIYNALTEKGVQFQPAQNDEDKNGRAPKKYIKVQHENIDEWWFKYWTDTSDEKNGFPIGEEGVARTLMASFVQAKASPKRNASIVVDKESLFKAICKYKDNNSYRGNLSVLLVDLDVASVIREEQLSHYYEDDNNGLTVL